MPDSVYLFRYATPSDGASVEALMAEHLPGYPLPWAEWLPRIVPGLYSPHVIVVETEGRIVGAAASMAPLASPRSGPSWAGRWWELAQLALDPAHRGQHLGFRLILSVASLGRRLGLVGMFGTFVAEQSHLVNFYVRAGFVVDEDDVGFELDDPGVGPAPSTFGACAGEVAFFGTVDGVVGSLQAMIEPKTAC